MPFARVMNTKTSVWCLTHQLVHVSTLLCTHPCEEVLMACVRLVFVAKCSRRKIESGHAFPRRLARSPLGPQILILDVDMVHIYRYPFFKEEYRVCGFMKPHDGKESYQVTSHDNKISCSGVRSATSERYCTSAALSVSKKYAA